MTDQERDIITRFIQRVGGAPQAGGAAGSVPSTGAPLPPIDKDADALIGQLFGQYPEARYRLTQLAFVQEHALTEAQNRINQLQAQLQQAQSAAPSASSAWGSGTQQPQQSRGFFGGLFGGGQSRQPDPQPQYAPPAPAYAPPAPQYTPSYQPGMLQRGGSGFLGSALTTAAGVAGGLVVGNALMNMFEPHGGGFGGGGFGGGGLGGMPGAAGFGGGEIVPEPPQVPWAGGVDQANAAPVDPWGAGGAAKDEPAADDKFANAPPPDSGWDSGAGGGDQFSQNSSFSDQGGVDQGWDDGGGGGGGGWDDSV